MGSLPNFVLLSGIIVVLFVIGKVLVAAKIAGRGKCLVRDE